MPRPATTRQKQFLRRLGHKDVKNLTVSQASNLIDALLEQEKKAGKKFPCPYCGGEFGPRPKRRKKCPHCGQTIYHITGKFYTAEQKDQLDQKEWFQERRREVRQDIRDDWREEKRFRKDGGAFWVGYLLRIGQHCTHAKASDGLVVLLEDAQAHPDMLPPYEECRHDSCECEYELVTRGDVPKGAHVAELVGDETTGGRGREKAGCAGLLLFAVAFLTLVAAIGLTT
ncbi:MAG: hypothetical protein ACOC7S_02760 [Planctomycetota bacterium]